MLGSVGRGRGRRPGGLAAARAAADADGVDEPRRLADDGGRAGSASTCCRSRRARREELLDGVAARTRRRTRRAGRSGGRGPAGRLRRARAAGRARHAQPAERLAFVLHDMFAVPFDEIAPIVGRSAAAARQLASRARRRVRGATPSPDADLGAQRRIVDAFLAAVARRVTSRRSSSCSTRTSSCASTPARRAAAARADHAAGVPWPARSSCAARPSPRTAGPCWSTAAPAWRSSRTAGRSASLGFTDRGRPDRRDRHPGRPRAAGPAGHPAAVAR